MPVKIRLARHGRKRNAYYYIVVANSRAPRDGKYIERIGSYNPNTNPATIELDFDKALNWMLKGAQPTDTARSILSEEGVLFKKHVLGGVKKGAFDEAAAEAKFEAWKVAKTAKQQAGKDALTAAKDSAKAENLAKEAEIKEARTQELAKRKADAEAEAAAAQAETATEAEENADTAEA
ncbi:30S ribosomal protein S16 [Prolixibacteraceae bacterium]|nr:30S ribosomal protein S16 [Prolixibacteraceae bacterium]